MYLPPPSHPADWPFALVAEQEFGAVSHTRFFASRADCDAALERELDHIAVSGADTALHVYRDGRLLSSSWFDLHSDEFRQAGPRHGSPALDELPAPAAAQGPFPF